MAIIETKNLTKKFKELVAVDNVNLQVEEGECFGLLGPNGAGKTSLIRMITAVSPPTSGEIWVLGKNLKAHAQEIKAVLGVVPQHDNLDPDLTVIQNLLTFARYFDIPRDEAKRRSLEVLALFELENRQNSHIKELSGGMKRRLLLARGLINQPRIMILDEPTIGLDPQARHLVWDKLTELKSQGVTRLLCTQNMEEAAILCNRVAIMHQGRILSLDSPANLVSRHAGESVWEIALRPEERETVVKELEKQKNDFESTFSKIYVFHMNRDDSISGLENMPLKIGKRPSTLEDVFLRLTGRSLAE